MADASDDEENDNTEVYMDSESEIESENESDSNSEDEAVDVDNTPGPIDSWEWIEGKTYLRESVHYLWFGGDR